MKRRQDIRTRRRETRRPWTLQLPDQDRRADRDAAFAELDREQARQIKQTLKS